MARKDESKKDQIILQQMEVIRSMTEHNLRRMGTDFWGTPASEGQPEMSGTSQKETREKQKKQAEPEKEPAPAVETTPEKLENLLAEDDIQAFFSLQEAVPKRAVYREVRRCPVVCVCSQEHPLAPYEQLTVEQLKEGGLIATCPPPIYPPALFPLQNQIVGERGPDQMLFCDSLEIVYTLGGAGYGFAIMTDLPPARLPGLRYIPIPQFEPLSFGVVYRADGLSPALRLFLSALVEQMEKE